GRPRAGAALAAFGCAAWLAIVLVVIPALGGHGYTYWDNLARHPGAPWTARPRTLALLLAPTPFLALRSPLLLVPVPTLACASPARTPSSGATASPSRAFLLLAVFAAFLAAPPPRWWVRVSLAVTAVLAAGLPLPQLAPGTGPHAAPLRELVAAAPDRSAAA